MQRSAWMRRFAAVTAAALLATACGGDDGDGGEEPATTTETATDTASPTEADTATETEGEAAPANEADGTLQLGYILPETGPLAFLGPPQIEAVQMAVDEINQAGGVLGNDVTVSAGDEAGDPTVASQTAQRLLGEGVDAIVGAASSGMSLAFIDAVTNAGVSMCSASNTSPTFTDYNDNGLYFRTAPTDALQGPVLAETIVSDGHTNVALMARADDYGQGLLNATRDALEEQGASVVAEVVYDPEAASFDSEVQQVANAGADAVAVIAFDEGAQILTGMIEAGIGPDAIGVYGADGLRSGDLAELVDPNDPSVLDGMKGTAPAGDASEEFVNRFREETGVDDTTFAAQAYDCTIMLALAAVAADSDAGEDIAAEMVNISRDGTKCTSFQECKDLLEQGEDIDYDGASGSVDFVDEGEPETGTYEVWQINAEGEVETVTTTESTISEA
jgi:ABC-type branched-subunit amino acid transport system substrate-binding protein